MIELNKLQHADKFAHVTITRIGEGRNTRYKISQSEEQRQSEERDYDAKAVIMSSEFLKERYGHIYES